MNVRRLAPLGLGLALLLIALQGTQVGVAQIEGDIGVIDIDTIWNLKLLPALEEQLIAETARLQAELDAAAIGKSEDEKQILFDGYQSQLYTFQQGLVDELLEQVRLAIAVIADELGLSVVLDANSVMYGGVDVTEAVLARLP